MGNIKKLQEHTEQGKQILLELFERIRNIPDNPEIKVLSTKPRTFEVKSGSLGKAWTPEYHDWKSSGELVIGRLELARMESVPGILAEIIEKQQVRYPGLIYKLHPGFVAELRKIAEE